MSQSDGDPGQEVRRLYEEYPYPDHGIVGSTVARMALAIIDPSSPVRILDAGCGTGEQTLGLARAFPRAEVIGIDLNDASLERARHYARKAGTRATFVTADLLADGPTQLGRFDLITSVGVLHHLHDPAIGLKTLRQLADDEGSLLGMVYGKYGKQAMFDERDAFKLLAGSDREARLAASQARVRPRIERVVAAAHELHQRKRFGPALPLRELAHRALAGRNRAFAADSYAHPQELAFTWGDVDALLSASGWTLQGWPPRSGMPDDPADLFRESAAIRIRGRGFLEQAQIYERLVRPSNLYFVARAREADRVP